MRGRYPIDLRGLRFGRLLVLEQAPHYVTDKGKTVVKWWSLCACGNIASIRSDNLRKNITKSCGCIREGMQAEYAAMRSERNAIRKAPKMVNVPRETCLFEHYQNMMAKHRPYVSKRWSSSYETFVRDMGRPPPKGFIMLINRAKDYGPLNCRWATPGATPDELR